MESTGAPRCRAVAVTIACTDIDRSENFYRNVLGARPDPRDGCGCRWFFLGEFQISLMQNATSRSPAHFPRDAMPILWLETDDLAAIELKCRENAVAVVQPSDGQFMVIEDPDGIVIEIWRSETIRSVG